MRSPLRSAQGQWGPGLGLRCSSALVRGPEPLRAPSGQLKLSGALALPAATAT